MSGPGVFMFACKKDPAPPAPSLSANKTAIEVTPAGGEIVLEISANLDWKLTLPAWIAADKSTGTGNAAVKLTAQQAMTTEPRTAAIKLEAVDGGAPAVNIAVTQKKYDYTTSWEKTFSVLDGASPAAIIRTTDNGFLVVGTAFNGTTQRVNSYSLKLNSDGTKARQKIYDHNTIFVSFVMETTAGYILAGTAENQNGGRSPWIAKLNSDGTLDPNQQHTIDDGMNYNVHINAMIATADGGFLMTGRSIANSGAQIDMIVLKLKADRTLDWSKTFVETNDSQGAAVVATGDGKYVVVGGKKTSADLSAIWVLKLNADGTKVPGSEKNIGGASIDDGATSILKTTDGFIVAGSKDDHAWVAKLDNSLNTLWEKTYDDESYAGSIAATADGFIVSGANNHTLSFALRLSKNGNKLWQKTFAATAGEYIPGCIATTSDGFVIASSATPNVWVARLKEQ